MSEVETHGKSLDEMLGTPEQDLLPIAQIAELQFCERCFYYRMVENADEVNIHVLQGRWEEDKRCARERVKRESGLQTRNLVVCALEIGIIGAVDVLEVSDEGTAIVEFKKGLWAEHARDDIQLCAQAMAWESMTGGTMEYGYVYYHGSRRRRKVWFTSDVRDAVVTTVERA